MINNNLVHPALIFIIGAILLPFLKWRILKQLIVLLIPAFAFMMIYHMPEGVYWCFDFLNYTLVFGRVDKLSLVFGYIFVIMAFLGMVYAIKIEEYGQHVAALTYIGGTLGVVFAGDFFTLFVFWELMAISSVFLVWYARNERALKAGFRYLMVHLVGGCVLLAGIIIVVSDTGTIAFSNIEFEGLGPILILIGFILNAAVPPLSAWLPDAYPEATVTGSVFMTAFTTKSAVYILARTFPGVEILVWLGAIMALYGVVFAVLENDIRRLLAYHIISQVGYMVCGVGLGSEMAINGASAHAFCHILYKALLFMGAGAVIHVTGKNKMTELQGRGLYKSMPITLTLYMVGAFSISAVPLFNGFISKTMVVAAAGELHRPAIELMLHLASVGTFLHTGLKLPWGTWFGKSDKPVGELKAEEPPFNMLLAMGIAAFLCVLTGIYPSVLYNILPYEVTYHPYTAYHVVGMLQLLVLTGAAFWLMIDKLGGEPTVSMDTDWFYRKGGEQFMRFCEGLSLFRIVVQEYAKRLVNSAIKLSYNPIYYTRLIFNKSETEVVHFDANIYRNAVGIGVMVSLALFSLFSIIFLVS
ncbi:MAG: Na(+)/H(+) antiporter subunit D [Spirochaetota bacterium]|nr:Na(+)/H(+) antiporter subunit D [Spirochaetota bacterium]